VTKSLTARRIRLQEEKSSAPPPRIDIYQLLRTLRVPSCHGAPPTRIRAPMRKTLTTAAISLVLTMAVPGKVHSQDFFTRFILDPNTASTTPGNANSNSGYIWQGFEHEWNRRILGFFRTPHRISKLGSEILDEAHELTLRGELTSTATLRMQQSTGVDGDWMAPVIHYEVFHSHGVEVRRGSLEIEFTDDTEASGTHGNALSQLNGTFEFLAPSNLSEGASTQALLHGFSLQTLCTEGPTGLADCNSNGIWPYRIKIEVESCTRKSVDLVAGETLIRCGYRIETGRAWTPRKGGLPPFEVKPLNRKTRYTFKVGVQIISGDSHQFFAFPLELGTMHARARPGVPGKSVPFSAVGAGENRYHSASVGLRSLEYDFRQRQTPLGSDSMQDMGRYLSGIGTSVLPEAYDPQTGEITFSIAAFTHVPGTVKNASLKVSTGLTLLQFAAKDAVSAPLKSEGLICVDSSPQAPAFSRWEKCGTLLQQVGGSRDTVVIPIEVRKSLR
jgi:hypothetical protein